jgi:RNA polymerase sigma-70 factor (ECF subfamily)
MQSETWREGAAAEIRSAVQKRHREAQQTFPDVRLDLQVLVQKVLAILGTRLPQRLDEAQFNVTATQFLNDLKWEALFLTTACASGDQAAWKIFDLRYRSVIQKAARYCSENYSEARELSDSLLSELFLPFSTESGEKTCKIGQYDGLGSLEGWIKVVVSRLAIDQIRRSQRQVSLEDLETDPTTLRGGVRESGTDGEMDLPKASKMFIASLNHAMEQLNAREKLILSLYYLRDLSLKEIGDMLRVHESTVSRTLNRLKKQLRKSVERHLREHFQVRSGEVSQLIEMAHLEVDVDLKRILTQ